MIKKPMKPLCPLQFSVLFAAVAMSVPATAGTTVGDTEYSGTILTWIYNDTVGTGSIYYGYWYETSYDEADGWTLGTEHSTLENDIYLLISKTSTTADYNTLRFVSGTSSPTGFSSTLAIAGIIVEEGATGFSITPGSSWAVVRTIYLGNATDTAAYSTINEDFTLSNALSHTSSGFYIQGTQTWTIASGRTFTLASANGFTISGSLTIDGEGTASFSGDDITSTADIIVGSGATLDWSGSAVTSTGTITNSGTIDLSGAEVSLSETIVNTGTVTVDADTTFDLSGEISSDGTVYVVISGGTAEGWSSLTADNFTVDGEAVSGRSTVSTTDFSINVSTAADLVWNGMRESPKWETNSVSDAETDLTKNWVNVGAADAFYKYDNVTFDDTAESKTVTVESVIAAGTVTVEADYTFDIAEGASVTATTLTDKGSLTLTGDGTFTAETVSVEDGATLTLSGAGTLSTGTLATTGAVAVEVGATLAITTATAGATLANVSGEGTVEVALTGKTSNALAIGDGTSFTGTTAVTSGYLSYTEGTIYGSTLEFGDGTRFYNHSSATFSGSLVLDGTTTFYLTADTTLTFDGSASVSGSTFSCSDSSSYTGSVMFEGSAVSLTSYDNNYGTTTFTGADVSVDTYHNYDGTTTFDGGNAEFDSYYAFRGTTNFTGCSVKVESMYVSYYCTTNFDGADVEIGILGMGNTDGAINVYGGTNLTLSEIATLNSTSSTYGTLSFGNATVTFCSTSYAGRKMILSTSLDDVYTGTVFCVADGVTFEIGSVISGDGSLEKTGTGTLVLYAANTFAGGLTVSEGTLTASGDAALGVGEVTIDGGTLSIDSDVVLEVSAITVVLSEVYCTGVTEADSSESGVATSGLVSISASTKTYALSGAGSFAEDVTIALTFDEALAEEIASAKAGTTYTFSLVAGALYRELTIDNFSVSGLGDSLEVSYSKGVLTAVTVPEPSGLGFLGGIGAAGLAVLRRRRRERKAA